MTITQAAFQPLVSIVINNYNYAAFLRDAIDSALAQTYPRCEVIVVDDGSTDESPGIIRSYGDRIRAVLKGNGGQGSALNAGFEVARGTLVAFLDSDDMFFPDKIARCVREAGALPSAQLIYHRVQTVDLNGRKAGNPYPRNLCRGAIADRVQKGGGVWSYAPTSGLVFRREFLERILPVPEDLYRTSADAYVACLAGMLTEVAGVDDVLAHYRVHGRNAWLSAGGGTEEQRLRHWIERFEIENGGLNNALRRFGSPLRVNLADNFVYQLWLRQSGRESSLGQLWRLALREPSERWVRVKTIARALPSLLPARRVARDATCDRTK